MLKNGLLVEQYYDNIYYTVYKIKKVEQLTTPLIKYDLWGLFCTQYALLGAVHFHRSGIGVWGQLRMEFVRLISFRRVFILWAISPLEFHVKLRSQHLGKPSVKVRIMFGLK